MAGERQFQTAAHARAVNRRQNRFGKVFNPVEQGVTFANQPDDCLFRFERGELFDVRADDEAVLFAADENDGLVAVSPSKVSRRLPKDRSTLWLSVLTRSPSLSSHTVATPFLV